MHTPIGYSGYPVLFTDSSPAPPNKRRQTCVSYKQNGFPICHHKKQEIESQIIKQAVPEIYKKGDENRFGSFKGKAWSVWLEFLNENG